MLELGRWAGCFAESCSPLVPVQLCGPRKSLLGGVKPRLVVLASLRTRCGSLGDGGGQEQALGFGFCSGWVGLPVPELGKLKLPAAEASCKTCQIRSAASRSFHPHLLLRGFYS